MENLLTPSPASAAHAAAGVPVTALDALFCPVVGADLPDVRELATAARVEFEATAWQAPALVPTPTVEELREQLRLLAPTVRFLLHEIQVQETTWLTPDGDRTATRAQVPPSVAHFALLSLALVEAESGAR
jgi:hypothetical protein